MSQNTPEKPTPPTPPAPGAKRNPIVQDLLDEFVVPNSVTGKRRAVAVLYRTLANSLAREVADSGELIEALGSLLHSKEKAIVGGLNPRPVPDTATPRSQPLRGGAETPKVTTDEG